jgi:hypothetical protein
MKVHHLNCGTMNMPGAPLVCHVLLIVNSHDPDLFLRALETA